MLPVAQRGRDGKSTLSVLWYNCFYSHTIGYTYITHCRCNMGLLHCMICIHKAVYQTHAIYGISHSLLQMKESLVVLCLPMSIRVSLVVRVTVNMHPLHASISSNVQPSRNLKYAWIPAEGETLHIILASEGKLLLVCTGTVTRVTRLSCPLLCTLCFL